MHQIKSWRSQGGDITAVPHLRKPIARLNNDLYTIKEMSRDGTMRIRITLAPRESIVMDIKVHHRNFAEWSQNRAGALVILPNGLRLCFTDAAPVKKSSKTVAYDFNFKRVVFARSDGQQREVDLIDAMAIQRRHKIKRESIQWTMAHNPAKAERLMAKTHEREHHRVNDLLHKKIHGRGSEIKPFIEGYHLGVEDLSRTTKEILKDDHGKEFNAKISSWIHGRFQGHHHAPPSRCGTLLHPGDLPILPLRRHQTHASILEQVQRRHVRSYL
jgi:transposase